jgi:hypothetical protein
MDAGTTIGRAARGRGQVVRIPEFLRRALHLPQEDPEADKRVRRLYEVAERERARTDELRRQRRTGNYLTDRLIPQREEGEHGTHR